MALDSFRRHKCTFFCHTCKKIYWPLFLVSRSWGYFYLKNMHMPTSCVATFLSVYFLWLCNQKKFLKFLLHFFLLFLNVCSHLKAVWEMKFYLWHTPKWLLGFWKFNHLFLPEAMSMWLISRKKSVHGTLIKLPISPRGDALWLASHGVLCTRWGCR